MADGGNGVWQGVVGGLPEQVNCYYHGNPFNGSYSGYPRGGWRTSPAEFSGGSFFGILHYQPVDLFDSH